MKRILLAFLLLSMPLAPMGWTGMTCTHSQHRTTYNTLYSVGLGVNQAYAAYLDQVVAGKATFNAGVADKYNKFQAAYGVAVQAASMNTNAIAPPDLVTLANEVYALIAQFKK